MPSRHTSRIALPAAPWLPPTRIELVRVTLHLPSGASALTGVVRDDLTAGPVFAEGRGNPAKPLADGGYQELTAGTDRTHLPPDPHGFTWAGTAPSDIQPLVEQLGFRLLSFVELAALLDSADMRLYPSPRAGGPTGHEHDYVIYSDDIARGASLVWHVPILPVSGSQLHWARHAFAIREATP